MNKFCPFTYKSPVYGNALSVYVFTKMGFKRRPQGSYLPQIWFVPKLCLHISN